MAQVTIYTTPVCKWCKASKDYFTENNVSYTEYDVSVDEEKRAEMFKMTEQLGVPVVRIDNTVIIGYDPEEFAQLLGLPEPKTELPH